MLRSSDSGMHLTLRAQLQAEKQVATSADSARRQEQLIAREYEVGSDAAHACYYI